MQVKKSSGLEEVMQNVSSQEFIETFFSIVSKDGCDVPFIFNSIQRELESSWAGWNVILKARKLGVSVLVQSKFLELCLRKKNQNCVILSYDIEASRRILERTDYTMNHLPFKIKLERESKSEFKVLDTNSKIYIGVAGSKAFGRGDDVGNLHVTEYAFYENPKILTGIIESLTRNPFVVVESTANGVLNDFAALYRKGKEGRSQWKSHFFPWYKDPELKIPVPIGFAHTEEEIALKVAYQLTDEQLAWRRQKLLDMLEPELFPVEYPANDQEAFLILGSCIFNRSALAVYDKTVCEPVYTGDLLEVA